MEKRQADLTNSSGSATVVLTKAQKDFIEFCQTFGWGKLEVLVQHGEPVLSKELERLHKHD